MKEQPNHNQNQKQLQSSKKLNLKSLKRNSKKEQFAKTYVKNGGNAKQAALEVFPDITPDSAKVKGSRLLTDPNVQEVVAREVQSLKDALVEQGITPELIAEKVDVLLSATKKVYRNNMKTGKIELVGEEPNHDAIDKGLKHAKEIYGVKTGDDIPDNRPNVVYNFFLNKDLKKKVEVVEGEIKQTLLNNVGKTQESEEVLGSK